MDIRVLNYFVTIAQEKNITRAADRLLVTQPTLSRQIKDLEEELGVTLFRRSSRELQLTEDGQYLYNRSLEILALVNKTEENLTRKGDIGGDLFIGTAETASFDLIAQASRSMLELYPQVHLHFQAGNADMVYEGLDTGTLDFGLIFGRSIPSKYQNLKLPRQDRWGVLVPIEHPLTQLDKLTLEDIVAYPLIVSSQTDIDKTAFANYDYRIVASYNLLYTASRLVQAGVGIALCLDCIVDNSKLRFLPLDENGDEEFHLIWKDRHDQTATEQAFVEEVEAQLYEEEFENQGLSK
ncbi:LysR family transcriptional regulator [Streptococcus troglodytae]|uniref:LysR family transcriptional regulator n=1 Tax=Streptococcus troglodytae TaxID=1111760 RepID=A0A1L7LJX7_9STRE|nr:LysR family transcriptional regulator [Streptococcus troglodytae]BAQ24459.1 LysR family transcriptional regulator [Streptococcus troglodytae]